MLQEHIGDAAATRWIELVTRGNMVKSKILLEAPDGGPEAVFASQPDYLSSAHYHHVAQFQLVVQGTLRMPTEAIPAIGVHYVDHNVAYGPFTTTPDFLWYTLHAKAGGQSFMDNAESRKKVNRQGRTLTAWSHESKWKALGGGVRRQVLLQEAGGLTAEVVECAAGAALPAPGQAAYGRYEVVSNGWVTTPGGKRLDRYGIRFTKGDTAAAAALTAGAEGATVAVLTYDADAAITLGGDMCSRIRMHEQELAALRAGK